MQDLTQSAKESCVSPAWFLMSERAIPFLQAQSASQCVKPHPIRSAVKLFPRASLSLYCRNESFPVSPRRRCESHRSLP